MWLPGSADTVYPRPSVTLTFEQVCESHLRCGTFSPKLSTIDLWVLELFTMYATDKRQTDILNAYCPFSTVGGIITYIYIERFAQEINRPTQKRNGTSGYNILN